MGIAVVGAGIGGLTAAVALRQAGFDVDVYEQAPRLTEVGGGINMGPNAARVLYRLGLGEALDHEAVRPASTHQRRWQDGRTLQRAPLNPLCERLYGAPHLTVHRADLLSIIASAFPAERIHLGRRLVGFADKGEHVEAWFENGGRVTADVLVGADGIHSAVRAGLFGEEAPRFAGCVAYRGLVPVERIADLELEVGSQSWVGPGGHFVHYFVSRGRLLNFVGWTEHDTWNREDWTDRATIARALAAFEGWHPQVRRIIAAAETCFIWALFDRDPLPRWSAGRVTLLGDACHPMYPFMGQGAAQAIEDGAVLAACLVDAADPIEALGRYETLRLPRVSRLQDMSRANKARFHLPDGPAQEKRDADWSRAGDRSPEALRWLYAFDAGRIPTLREEPMSESRFPTLTPETMTADQKRVADAIQSGPRGAGLRGPFNVLLRSPELCDLVQRVGAFVRFGSSIPPRLNELAIIMAGRKWTAQYEFYAHRRLAIEAGLKPAITDAIAANQRPAGMAEDETMVYEFVTELLATGHVSDAAYKRVKDAFGERGVVDLVGAVGYYSIVSMMLNVGQVPLPDGVTPPLK